MLHFFRKSRWAAALAALVFISTGGRAQSPSSEPRDIADPEIAGALRQISAQRIQANIEKLASFGTRLTLSAQDSASIAAGRGIGAAREWIKSEFDRYSKDCDGCLEVKTDTFTEQPSERIPKATEIANVYAVLKGTDAASMKRIVLVTGTTIRATATSSMPTAKRPEPTTTPAEPPSAWNARACSAR